MIFDYLGVNCNNPIFTRFILLFIYVCLYVINCLCVYFGLGLVDFGVRRVLWSFYAQGYFGHFVSKGKLVISW